MVTKLEFLLVAVGQNVDLHVTNRNVFASLVLNMQLNMICKDTLYINFNDLSINMAWH